MNSKRVVEYFKKSIPLIIAGLSVIGLLVIVKSLYHIFILLILSLVFASAIELPVNKLCEFKIGRRFATIFSLLGSILLTGGVLIFISILVSGEIKELVEQVGTYGGEISSFIKRFGIDVNPDNINNYIVKGEESLFEFLKNESKSLTTLFVDAMIVIFFSYYIVVDGKKLRRSIVKQFPVKKQELVLDIWQIVIEKTGGYLVTRLLLIVISSISSGIFATVIGIPYGWAIGIWFGVISQTLPIIGTYLGLVVPLAVAFNHELVDGILFIIYVILFQFLADYFLLPKIASHTLELHPATIFLSVLIGGTLLGFTGILISIPVAATINSIVVSYMKREEIEHNHKLI